MEVVLGSISLRCSFTPGYRPVQLGEAEPFIQYADRLLIFGGRDGLGRVEIPFDRGSGGGGGPANTDALLEGTSNLYFTQARVRASLSVGGALSYNQATGLLSYTPPSLAAVAFSGLYTDLSNRPNFAAVASSGSASDLATGTLPAARLPSSGVTAGTYGSGTQIPVVTTDGAGRVTSISTVAAPTGPSSTDGLPEGTANLYFTQGRARAAISAAGSLAYNATTGVLSYTAPTLAAVATSGSASDLTAGTLPAARLPNSGATAGTYGSGSLVPVITVDSTGRITSVTTAANAGGGGGSGPSSTDGLPEGTTNLYFTQARARAAISASGSLAYNSSTGVISYTAPTLAAVATSGSASDLTTGTLPSARFPSSGVTAGSYTVASITVDSTGRITAASSGPVAKQTVAFSCVGKPAAGEVLGMHVADVPFTVGANFANTQARALAAATNSAAVSITRIPAGSTTETTIGTLTWAAGATLPTYSTQAAVAFAIGDAMRCICPSTQDSTLADFAISVYGAR